MNNGIGSRIKTRREELGMTQEELAKRLSYKSRSSINKIELGIYNLTQAKIKAIADVLSVTPDYIMGWGQDSTNLIKAIGEEFGPVISETFELIIRLNREYQIELRGVVKQMLREGNKNRNNE